MKKTLFLIIIIVISKISLGQNGKYENRRLKKGEKVISKEILDNTGRNELTFVFFVPLYDSTDINSFIKENKIKSGTKGINYFVYNYAPTNNSKDDPFFNELEIEGDKCFAISNNSDFCQEIISANSTELPVSLERISKSNEVNIYKLNIVGICSSSKLKLYCSRIIEIKNTFKEKYLNVIVGEENKSLLSQINDVKIKLDTISVHIDKYFGKKNSNYLSFSPSYNTGKTAITNKNSNSQQYDTKVFSRQGFGFGISYQGYLSHKKDSKISNGFGIGINYLRNDLNLSADKVYFSYSTVDKDGETYQRRIYGSNIKEAVSLNFMEMPINYIFDYRLSKSKEKGFSLFFNLGVKFSYLFSGTYQATNGTLSYRGKYNGIKSEFKNMSDYSFYENTQINKEKQNLDIKRLSCYGFIGGGLKYSISSKIDISISAYTSVADNNFVKDKSENYIISENNNEYNSLLFSLDKFKINPTNFSLGFTYKF